MRRSPRIVPLTLWAAAAVVTLVSLLLTAPASADSVSSVGQCPSGDRSSSSVGSASVTAKAPDGYRISSFCVVGRGNAGPEVHTLSSPQATTVIQHSSGRQLVSYSVTYVRIPVASEPDPEPATSAAPAEKSTKPSPSAKATQSSPSDPAAAEGSESPEASARLLLPGDGEQFRITRFEEKDEREDRWSFLVVGGIIVVGLVAGAIALMVRLPGQR